MTNDWDELHHDFCNLIVYIYRYYFNVLKAHFTKEHLCNSSSGDSVTVNARDAWSFCVLVQWISPHLTAMELAPEIMFHRLPRSLDMICSDANLQQFSDRSREPIQTKLDCWWYKANQYIFQYINAHNVFLSDQLLTNFWLLRPACFLPSDWGFSFVLTTVLTWPHKRIDNISRHLSPPVKCSFRAVSRGEVAIR